MSFTDKTVNTPDTVLYSETKSVSLLKFYAEYYDYVSLKFSEKYTKSVTTVFNHLFRYFGKNRSVNSIEYHEWDTFFYIYLKHVKGELQFIIELLKRL